MNPAYVVPMVVSNVLVLVLAWLCWRRPTVGRLTGGLMFIAAGLFNAYSAMTAPQIYLAYRPLVWLEAYRWVIDHLVAPHGTAFIGAIALGQLAVGLLLVAGGWAARLGAIGAIIFFISITPLGMGSAFPFPLVAIAGFAALLARRAGMARRRWQPRHRHP